MRGALGPRGLSTKPAKCSASKRRIHASTVGRETRKKRLMKELGGIGAIKAADLDTFKALPWLPDAVAEAVYAKIHGA